MNFQYTLVKRIFIVITISITLFAGFMAIWLWKSLLEEKYSEIEKTALFLNSYFELTFFQRELGLRSIGERMLSIDGPDATKKRLEIASNSLTAQNDFMAIGLVDTTGQLITFTGALEQDNLPNLSESENTRRTFEQAKKAKSMVIGEVYFFDEVSSWILPIRVPLRNADNKLIAVNTSAISLRKLVSELNSFNLDSNYRIHFVNGDFNTSQLIYPLNESQYDSHLHQDAAIIKDEKIVQKGVATYFEGTERINSRSVIGVRTEKNSQNHFIEVFIDKDILWLEYIESSLLIVFIYFFVITLLFLVFGYLRNSINRYEEALTLERDYSNKIIQSTSALVVGINSKDICTFINPAAEKITGYIKSEIVGKNWWETLYPKEDFEQVNKLLEKIAEGDIESYEMRLTAKNGEKKIVSWNSIRLYNQAGAVSEIIGLGIDVTNQKLAEKDVIARQANLNAIVESTNHGIALIDANYNLMDFNEAFYNHYVSEEEIHIERGHSVVNIIKEPIRAKVNELLERSLKGEKLTEQIEYSASMQLSINFNPVYEENKVKGVSVFIQDITAFKNAQEELRQYSENLEMIVQERSREILRANENLNKKNSELKQTLVSLKKAQNHLVRSEKMASLGVLSAGVGHEINNPLNFIKGGLNELSLQLKKSDQSLYNESLPFIEIINEGVKRATTIVKSLGNFSRQTKDQSEQCDIHKIIDNCLTILQSKLKHRVVVEKSFCNESAGILGNDGQLHQAFLNILSNAEQAISDKGTIKITTQKSDRGITVEIADTGMGISPENLERISDPFFTTKEPGKGTGLGLSITYKIIEDHHGEISVKSDLDNGTLFTIFLPIMK